MTTPPELAALEAELARLRPAEVTFDAETILDRAPSRRVGRKTRPGLAARFAWVATGFVAGAVFMAVGLLTWNSSLWNSFLRDSTPTAEVTCIEQIRVPEFPDAAAEEDLAVYSAPPADHTQIEEETSEEPMFPATRYTALSRAISTWTVWMNTSTG